MPKAIEDLPRIDDADVTLVASKELPERTTELAVPVLDEGRKEHDVIVRTQPIHVAQQSKVDELLCNGHSTNGGAILECSSVGFRNIARGIVGRFELILTVRHRFFGILRALHIIRFEQLIIFTGGTI